MQNPFEVTLHNQADDEEILRIWRHHPITFVKPAVKIAAFLLVPLAILLFTGLSFLTSPWLFGIFLVILAISVTYTAYEWVSWYGDVYVLTNYRVVDVEQHGFFSRKFSEAGLEKIQDVNTDVTGILQTVLKYGNVDVQTAGANHNITLEAIRSPQEQAVLLLKEQKRVLEDQGESTLTADQLIELLTKHKDHLDDLAGAERKEQTVKVDDKLAEAEAKEAQAKKTTKKRRVN